MRQRFFILGLSFLVTFGEVFVPPCLAQTSLGLSSLAPKLIGDKLRPFFTLTTSQIEELTKGEVLSLGEVLSPTPQEQQMLFYTVGIHPRSCTRAMRKLSLYENYPQYIDFVKEAQFQEREQKLSLTFDHALLPYALLLRFKIPRITQAGHYPFVFEEGFLKDLKGTIFVVDLQGHCLLGAQAKWQGKKTPLPNLVLSSFVQTLGRLGLERLIRVSLF